jgi:hypothetical protein
MENIALRGHHDGTQIRLDDPFELRPNTKLLITVVQNPDVEKAQWQTVSAQGLAKAYSNEEPEYPSTCVKEHNSA